MFHSLTADNPVKTALNRRKTPSIVVASGDIRTTQTMSVRDQGLHSQFVLVIGENHSRVFHELGNVRRFSSWSGAHVKHFFALLWSEGHDWKERGRGLKRNETGWF